MPSTTRPREAPGAHASTGGSRRPGALNGVRVLDLSRVLAGPYAAQMLADHGADVIKIEPPQGDETRRLGPPFVDESAAYYHGLNRNKRAISLDLSRPEGQAVLRRLLAGADVLVENFLPGTMEKWGLDHDALAAQFPRLVYCSITGFGADGPLGGQPGYDAVLQALCGLMSVNGHPGEGATRIGIPVVDVATAHHAAFAVMLALYERAQSGRGQHVECCLFDTALSLLHPHSASWLAAGTTAGLTGNAHPTIAPYDKFRTGDGEVFLGVLTNTQFAKLCALLQRADLAADPRYAGNAMRLRHREALREELEAALAALRAEPLCAALMRAGVPAAPVNSVEQALTLAHTEARGMVCERDGLRAMGVPVRLSRTPGAAASPAPAFAEHTDAVLDQAGYTAQDRRRMEQAGVLHRQPRR